MPESAVTRSPSHRWMAVVLVLVVAGVGLTWVAARVPFSSEILRARVIRALSDKLNADVELTNVSLRLLPRFEAKGEGLVVRQRGRGDVPPLFSVEALSVRADVVGLLRRHVAQVRLEGLRIQIPPGDEESNDANDTSGRRGPHLAGGRQVVVDVLEAPGAKLIILPKRKNKAPKIWDLHELRITSVSANTAMPFAARLTNAVPPGEIASQGSFGPWHRDDPGHTPVRGQFTFDKADLGVFKGIDGTLSSTGTYEGSLDRILVRGETDTPDFTVTISGHKVPLKTTYLAVVDGTTGDTQLEEVNATFLNTSLTAKGGVFDVEGVKGRRVTLNVTIDRGRVEDVLRLAVKTPRSPMSGALRLSTRFDLPPGDRDVVDKLKLNGGFAIEQGRFADPKVQQQVNTLSRRARGERPAGEARRVTSTFTGRFALHDGVLTLPSLTFDVPGAVVEVKGKYALRSQTVDFGGELVLDAKLSETTSGFKSLLLKIVDPLFRRDGQTVVPITITGTPEHPSFGLDVKRVLTRKEVARRSSNW